MDIPTTKIKLIHWLTELEDQSVLEKIIDVQEATVTLTNEQKEELDRRLDSYEAGNMKFFSWDDVKSRIKNSIKDAS